MPTAEATITTDRAARYLDQFCQHAGQVHRIRHRIRAHATGAHLPHTGQVTVHRDNTEATIDFGWARCRLTIDSSTLNLRVEAEDDQALQSVQDIITADLNRFGRREQLTISWLKSPTPHDDHPGPR